jgi:hypothetical protein
MARLFFSYSHKDEELRNELETHLVLLKRQGVISSWHDRRITAGGDVHREISAELESAQIVLLLVSAHFLASDYCYEKEMERALERHNEGRAVVIPVILHPCDWHSAPFGHLRATPTDGKAVSMFANQHEAFSIVAKDVRAVAERLADQGKGEGSAPPRDDDERSRPRERSSNLRIKRKFDDHERDEFLEDSYEYIARYFEGSLDELETRNPQIKTRFKRVDATSFTAAIYEQGKRVAECSIWYGGDHFGSNSISYSNSASSGRNSFNESLSVVDDGYTLALKPLGMQSFGRNDEALSQQGGAELFWGIFIGRLQE